MFTQLNNTSHTTHQHCTHLLRNHRQHFQLNPIKLIKTRPRARTRQPLKKLAHSLVVQPIRAIKHNALYSQSLGQIFGGFGLSGSGRPSGCTPQVHVNGSHECAVASVGEGGDDESSGVA